MISGRRLGNEGKLANSSRVASPVSIFIEQLSIVGGDVAEVMASYHRFEEFLMRHVNRAAYIYHLK